MEARPDMENESQRRESFDWGYEASQKQDLLVRKTGLANAVTSQDSFSTFLAKPLIKETDFDENNLELNHNIGKGFDQTPPENLQTGKNISNFQVGHSQPVELRLASLQHEHFEIVQTKLENLDHPNIAHSNHTFLHSKDNIHSEPIDQKAVSVENKSPAKDQDHEPKLPFISFSELMEAITKGLIKWEEINFRPEIVELAFRNINKRG